MTLEELGRERATAWAMGGPRRAHEFPLLALGLALSMSTYTLAVGIALLLLALLSCSMPTLMRWAVSRSWSSNEHLQGEQLHAIDHESIRFETRWLRARSAWSNLDRWALRDGNLYFWCRRVPVVVIPEHILVEAGCLQDVLAQAHRSAAGTAPAAPPFPPTCMGSEVRVTRYVSEEDLLRRAYARARGGIRTRVCAAALTAAGGATMAFTRPAFSCGLLMLLVALALLVGPVIVTRRARRRRTWAPYAGEEEHALDADGIGFRTALVELWSPWASLTSWRRADGCLFLHCRGMPEVVIPEQALVEAGCLDEVLGLARLWAPRRDDRR